MEWIDRLINLVPRQTRALVFIMALVISALVMALVVVARRHDTGITEELQREKDRADRFEQRALECEISMRIHLVQDMVKDSIEDEFNKNKIEQLQKKIDTIKMYVR